MGRLKINLVKNATCEKCGTKLYKPNFFVEITSQYVEITAVCYECNHSFVIDRKHREAINR